MLENLSMTTKIVGAAAVVSAAATVVLAIKDRRAAAACEFEEVCEKVVDPTLPVEEG